MPEFILNNRPALTHARAAEIAAAWGSYMNAGDPGAIFYTFPADGTAPKWDENDRAAALSYCDSCLWQARRAGSGPTDAAAVAKDVADLEALRRYIEGDSAFAQLDQFAQGFVEAAFFCNVCPTYAKQDWGFPECQQAGIDGTRGGDLPSDATTADIDPASLEAVKALCQKFQNDAAPLLAAALLRKGYDSTQAGRDLYFTRAGHATGYWARSEFSEKLAESLTEAAGRAEILLSYDAESGVIFEDV